jgi:hypothetical protein
MQSKEKVSTSYAYADHPSVFLLDLDDIEPPSRSVGVERYRSKECYEQIKSGMQSGDQFPPIEVIRLTNEKKFAVYDGFHRFYISKELGFSKIPVRVIETDLKEFFRKEDLATFPAA